MSAARSGLLLGALAVLGGCCSGVTTDPRAGGLAGGVCGEVTGAYDTRLSQRMAVLGSLDDASASLSRDLESSRRETSSLDRRIAAQQRRLGNDRTALREIERDIAAARAEGRLKAERETELKNELRALDAELAGLLRRGGESRLAERALRDGVATGEEARALETRIGSDERRNEARRLAIRALKEKAAAPRQE